MAEREGFEPSVRLHVHTLSRRALSTAQASLLLNLDESTVKFATIIADWFFVPSVFCFEEQLLIKQDAVTNAVKKMLARLPETLLQSGISKT